MTRLFGTDGIRGEAGAFPLDERTVRRLGVALGRVLASELGRAPRVVIGRDTRESGPQILAWLADGLARAGATARSAGVVPTPSVSFLARQPEFDAGIVVSASHNPWHDNGLKVFSHRGTKLDDRLESAVEAGMSEGSQARLPDAATSPPDDETELRHRHVAALAARFRSQGSLSGTSLVIDCAHGAAAGLAGELLASLGASVRLIADAPDGRNINLDCGSVHPERLAADVKALGADAGVAFDGDADRCVLVDERGALVDGDNILLSCADAMQARGGLRGGGVVGTVMSNFGLERGLRDRGLRLVREGVGDRNVLERMLRDGYNLGGEPSGHVIFLDDEPTGDGLLTALHALFVLSASGRRMSDLADLLPRTPQLVRNVRARARQPLSDVAGYAALVSSWESRLGGDGRVLVRWSGTERLVRVMAEGADAALVTACVDEIADHLARALGD